MWFDEDYFTTKVYAMSCKLIFRKVEQKDLPTLNISFVRFMVLR